MRKVALIVLLILTRFSVTAQISQGAKDSAKAEIKQLINEWNKAIQKNDSLTLERILASEYTLYSYNGSSTNRSGWLSNLNHFTTDSISFVGDVIITVYGQAAKSEGMMYWKTAWDGKPRKITDYHVTDIWLKRDGRWQVLMRLSQLREKK